MNRIPALRRPALLAALCILAQAALPAQELATKWPKLDSAQNKRVRVLIEKLDPDDEEQSAEAESELAGLGAAIAPRMLRGLGDDSSSTFQVEAYLRILDEVVEPQYAALVAERADDRAAPVRRWCMGWLALHAAKSSRAQFESALDDKDPETSFRAAVGLVSLGEIEPLQIVFDSCNEEWPSRAVFVAATLPAARGDEAADWVFEHMPADDQRAQVTGLRLLRSLATADQAPAIGVYLDAEQHAVKKEAINALRAVVDGDPPLEKLSVFQVIEQAKQWKARL